MHLRAQGARKQNLRGTQTSMSEWKRLVVHAPQLTLCTGGDDKWQNNWFFIRMHDTGSSVVWMRWLLQL
jgi:hypothetical protein